MPVWRYEHNTGLRSFAFTYPHTHTVNLFRYLRQRRLVSRVDSCFRCEVRDKGGCLLLPRLVLREGDRGRLADLGRLPSVSSVLAKRAQIVLLAVAGMRNAEIARMVGCRGRR
jgi:hypothetical protein